jgi:hypothetical protein
MATDVLQRFLTKRLFDVGADDNRVKPLRDAAADVAALIKTAPQRTATFTMVAIDAGVGPDQPLVGEVMKILEKHWQSYAGAFTDSKLPTVARAILLHALSMAMGSEPIAAAVSLTARNMLPHLGDAGDRELWADIIGDAERRLGLKAERDWALPSAAKAVGSELTIAQAEPLVAPGISRDWLSTRLEAAAGPHNENGDALASSNPNFPNAGAPWSHKFGPIAATAISSAVNNAIKTLVERLGERDAAQELRAAVSEYVAFSTIALTRTAVGLERRTALLWWKEALYSPAARASYRDLDPSAAAALAAIDASAQTGAFAPRMAEAMVRETLRSIDGNMLEERSLVDHCTAIGATTGDVHQAIQTGFAAIHGESGRAPLGALLTRPEPGSPAAIETGLGLSGDTLVSAIDLGIWLFRDLQASAATPVPAKRGRAGKPA